MSTLGDSRGARLSKVGVALPTPPRQGPDPRAWQEVAVQDFTRGYNSGTIPELVQAGASPLISDLLVDQKGRLVKAPGIVQASTLAHTPTEMFAHAALSDYSDVVLVASPYMGVRSAGVVNWYNVSFPPGGGWVSCLHGDQLLMSNNYPGTDVYMRAPLGTSVTALGWGEAGTLLSFVGRVWAANANIGGVANPLGVKWTGASGDPTDIDGEGSGFELLLQDSTENDRILALREIGFDLMVLVLRKSIWIGTPTGDVYRPVDFRPRITGLGAINEATVRTVQGGIMFLSDSGVKFFDGNNGVHKSAQIDSDILPLDYTKIDSYSGTYVASRQQYILHTPTETWTYDVLFDRWFKSTAIVRRSLGLFNPFTQSYSGLSAGWNEDWGGFWDSVPPGGLLALSDDVLYLQDDKIGAPSPTLESYFDDPQQMTWESVRSDAGSFDGGVQYDHFEFEYEGQATVRVLVPDMYGLLTQEMGVIALPLTLTRRQMRLYSSHSTGRGLGCRLELYATQSFRLRRFAVRFRAVPEFVP